jgi:23S rRNA pseudouridine2605 synthase
MNSNELQQGIRLQKFLSAAGICSRRHGEAEILKGDVLVDGRKVAIGTRVFNGQVVTFRGIEIKSPKKNKRHIVIALNKPRGFICSHSDPLHHEDETIYSLLPLYKQHKLFCCGRLDKDSEGLVLLSDDGDLAAQLMHPSSGIIKRYHVTIDKPLLEKHEATLIRGISDHDELLTLQSLRKNGSNGRHLDIALSCGKKRHIRRMFAHFDYAVKSLERYQIGALTIGNIKRGRYFTLQEKHIKKLFSNHLET